MANHAIQIQGEQDVDAPLIHNVRIGDTGEQMLIVSGGRGIVGRITGWWSGVSLNTAQELARRIISGGIDAHHEAGICIW